MPTRIATRMRCGREPRLRRQNSEILLPLVARKEARESFFLFFLQWETKFFYDIVVLVN